MERNPISGRSLRSIRITIGGLVAVAIAGVSLKRNAIIELLEPNRAEAAATVSKADSNKVNKEQTSAPVAVATVETGSISDYIRATANLVAENEVQVVAEVEGKIVELLVEEGSYVSKGQKLAQIDPRDATLAVQRAELALRNAENALSRSEKMAAENLISPQELDKVRYERDLARHGLAEMRRQLEKTNILAPFGGRITVRAVLLGQTVKPGEELLILADYDPLIARVFLPEREVIGLRPGQPVSFTLKADPSQRFAGRIHLISPVVDTASGTVKLTVEAVAPPAAVRPGAFVSVDIVRETHPDAMLIPRPAVVRELQETYVFVVKDTQAHKRAVQVGLEEGERYEIVAGVEPGELVVTSGQGGLKDRAPIQIAAAALGS